MEKKEALQIIFQCADLYRKNLCDQMLLIISANNSINKIFATEILFERTNYMHLSRINITKILIALVERRALLLC
jgi:hypothetical protein